MASALKRLQSHYDFVEQVSTTFLAVAEKALSPIVEVGKLKKPPSTVGLGSVPAPHPYIRHGRKRICRVCLRAMRYRTKARGKCSGRPQVAKAIFVHEGRADAGHDLRRIDDMEVLFVYCRTCGYYIQECFSLLGRRCKGYVAHRPVFERFEDGTHPRDPSVRIGESYSSGAKEPLWWMRRDAIWVYGGLQRLPWRASVRWATI